MAQERDIQHATCAHCGAQVAPEEAVRYEHHLLYGEHVHCRTCDPEGTWDCISHDFDMDLH